LRHIPSFPTRRSSDLAQYLAEKAEFDGTIIFIFQPDEEDQAGARRMVEDGLFEKFPVDAVYAVHNFPGAPAGKILIKKGTQMAGDRKSTRLNSSHVSI